jgi:hypothetical protein
LEVLLSGINVGSRGTICGKTSENVGNEGCVWAVAVGISVALTSDQVHPGVQALRQDIWGGSGGSC